MRTSGSLADFFDNRAAVPRRESESDSSGLRMACASCRLGDSNHERRSETGSQRKTSGAVLLGIGYREICPILHGESGLRDEEQMDSRGQASLVLAGDRRSSCDATAVLA